MEVLDLVLPIFAVMVTGVIVGHTKILPERTADILIKFVFYIAIPALLFMVIGQEKASSLFNPPFLAVLGGGFIAAYAIILLGAIYWRGWKLGAATMLAASCVASNSGFVALPILHASLGHKAVLPAAIANIIVVFLFLVTVALLERAQVQDSELAEDMWIRVRRTLTNPVILSTVLGVAYATTGLGFPVIVVDYLQLLADALTPCALFAIGMSIRFDTLKRSGTAIVFATFVKLIVMPALVFGLAWSAGLSPLLAIAATVAAAVPTAKTTYVLADQYHQEKELVGETISVTTLVSALTLIVWLIILSHVYPGAFSGR